MSIEYAIQLGMGEKKKKLFTGDIFDLVFIIFQLSILLHSRWGEKVEEGQALCIVEAMKMENVLYAEQPGVIKTINFVEGDILSLDDKIIEFE